MEDRKKKHIELALQTQLSKSEIDNRFEYEPMMSAHPVVDLQDEFIFLEKKFRVPIWISSMTGGTPLAKSINTNLAKACHDFGMGMGLGSCRVLLDDDSCFNDFNVRNTIGDDKALFANLGICQIEQLISSDRSQKIHDLVHRLQADGLIIHVNPIQEWIQPEGDRLKNTPVKTIEKFIENTDYQIIVKEVGQGMGRESLTALLRLPLAAIEFAAFGGTNFSNLELQRRNDEESVCYVPFSRVGVDAGRMTDQVNSICRDENNIRCKQVIVSGGIKSFLDGYYYISKLKLPAIYGQASEFLKYAKEGYEPLHRFVEGQVAGLRMAQAYLRIRE